MQPGQMIGEVQRQPSVPLAERFESGPDDLAGSGQRIEIGRVVAFDARRQDFGFENRRGERRALQIFNGVEQRIEPTSAAHHALPMRDQPSEHRRLDRLDLMSQLCQRSPPDRLQDLGIAPLAAGASGPEIALEQAPAGGKLFQQRLGDRSAETVSRREVRRRERRVRPGVPACQIDCRMRH